ncbi:wd repeat domain phosphoinositide-interactingprotein 3 [Lichtheimia corymbifera JMRC:FSU:9682]|uniref:Wd repeat domain phosphoinositide-interactingprotein 3 n=1 Tax=Lichtheimia corymbifera JMRC:FSU:9682 TaxID=1263082 RepID=A0A068S8F9_9FUNG|nr:wd repeat domain phosphoinositide-interactingprotein 3 [Lichtheimia corymbifera JMRC:FSU:9682]
MNLTRTISNSGHAPGFLYAGFNQDYGCFSTGLDKGFRVYNCDPLIEQARVESADGGFGIVEMLYRTNYLALVGGGRNPRYPPNKVIIHDSIKGKPVLELEYKSNVRSIKLRRDRLAVVLSNKVFVYQFSVEPRLLYTFETCDNDRGLAAISSEPNHGVLVIPGRQRGHLQIVDLDSLGYQWPSTTTAPGSNNEINVNVSIIAAHSGRLSCVALNRDGTKCATASDKGTLIRVFNTMTGSLLNELRRGMDRAEIYSLAFNHDSTRLCVSSDKGTIHVFNLDPSVVVDHHTPKRGPTYGEIVVYPASLSAKEHGLTDSGNRGSSLSFMKDLLPKYFSSEWSFAHAKIVTESRCIVAFGEERNTIIAICADGSWYKFCFDPRKGGECTRESFERFLKNED